MVIPLVTYLAQTDRSHFDSDASKRSFLHWMYAAMMWGRYSGSTETKLQADVEALKADDAPGKLRDNLIADRGRITSGLRADLNVIDFDALQLRPPEMVHDLPAGGRRLVQRVDGYRTTIVAGEVTYEDGVPTGARPGRLVRSTA